MKRYLVLIESQTDRASKNSKLRWKRGVIITYNGAKVLRRALKGVNFAAGTIISSVSNAATCLLRWEDQETFSAYGKVGRASKPRSNEHHKSLCGPVI